MTGEFIYFPPASPSTHECSKPHAESCHLGTIWRCECGQHWIVKMPPPPPIEGARFICYADRKLRWARISERKVRRIIRKARNEEGVV